MRKPKERGTGLRPAEARRSMAFAGWQARVVATRTATARGVGEVSEEYTTERQRVLRSSIEGRIQLVRDVRGGASVDSAELGYRLEQEHLAVVATGPAADASLRDLARRLERSLLTVAMTD